VPKAAVAKVTGKTLVVSSRATAKPGLLLTRAGERQPIATH
jgi:hypothetical protein